MNISQIKLTQALDELSYVDDALRSQIIGVLGTSSVKLNNIHKRVHQGVEDIPTIVLDELEIDMDSMKLDDWRDRC